MDVAETLSNFASQSERVLNVTHKPRGEEFWLIAKSTAVGMALIGVLGFAVYLAFSFIR